MQEALRRAKLTEKKITTENMRGVRLLRPRGANLGWARAGAKLLDAFPSIRIQDVTPPKTCADLKDPQ